MTERDRERERERESQPFEKGGCHTIFLNLVLDVILELVLECKLNIDGCYGL